MIKRQKYLEKFQQYIGIPGVIKVISGMRRCGKTYFLRQIMTLLEKEKSISKENIVYINKEDVSFSFLENDQDLYAFINKKIKTIKGNIYLFIDEIQDIHNWENAIRSFAQDNRFEIFITGSNSHLLSGELASYLTGRCVEFWLYPLTFSEFLEFRGEKKERIKTEFTNFMRYGGLPAIHQMNFNDDLIESYLSGVFDSILLKDIVARYNVRNSSVITDIFHFLTENIGNTVSSKKIADYLKKEKIPLSLETLREYLYFFQTSFLLYKANRFDTKGKKLLEINEKYFLGDIGIRSLFLGFSVKDIGRVLENIVYLELKSRGYQITIGKVGNLEVDFIAEKNGKKEYYQVTYLLHDEAVVEREFGAFQKISDNYPKYVLSMDEFWGEEKEGVHRKNIIDWLLKGNE